MTDRASFSWRWSGRCRARSAAEANALVAILVTALASSSALAAAPQYCVLWAREDVRISLMSTTDIDLITATPELIRRMFDRRYAWCVSQKAEYLGLPGGDKRLTDAWVAFMAERIIGKRQPEPEPAGDAADTVMDAPEQDVANKASKQAAGDEAAAANPMSVSGFPIGSPEHLDWCRAGYRTWDEATRTVIRRESGGRRVPCP